MFSVILKCPVAMGVSWTETRLVQGVMQKYLKHDKNTFSVALAVRTFLTSCTKFSDGAAQLGRSLKPSRSSQDSLAQQQNLLKLDVNTNVQNNVILYKYENKKYFRNVKLFAWGQLFGWAMLASNIYSPSLLHIFKKDVKLKEYVKDNGIRLILLFFSVFLGVMIHSTIYFFRCRTIKYIILNKGGKRVTFTTYHPKERKSITNVPVDVVKSIKHRTETATYIPFKIKNRAFYYLIDKRGTFLNPQLFDHTIGYA